MGPCELTSHRWSDFYGPVSRHGGQFTNLRRYNFSSPYASLGLPVYGYLNDSAAQPQTFQAENIGILSDGFCGSTCALFVELMKTQAGVRSIAVGGRKQYGPMQTVGGSKGSNDQQMAKLVDAASDAYNNANATQRSLFSTYIKAGLAESAQQLLNRIGTSGQANVNFLNNIRNGDESVTPLMFVYEAAGCRQSYYHML